MKGRSAVVLPNEHVDPRAMDDPLTRPRRHTRSGAILTSSRLLAILTRLLAVLSYSDQTVGRTCEAVY
jgi:hypothetical protein